jgi:hypothetical protein
MSNDGFGFCPNVTFEHDEFKEDPFFLLFLKLFIFNLFRLSFNLFNITSNRFVNLKTHMFAGTGARFI